MWAYFIRRLYTLLVTLFTISVLIFIVLNIIPGDPAQIIAGTEASPEVIENIRKQLGLDRPPVIRYLDWLRGVLVGDFGYSIHYKLPIVELIATRLWVTVPLALLAIVFTVVIGVPLGMYAATHHGTIRDYGIVLFSQLGIAVPAFWAGILLIILFAVYLGWLPSGGIPTAGWSDPLATLKALLLPAFSLGLAQAAVITRLTRSSILEVLREDYVQAARSKGLSENKVIYKHVLKNAFVSVLTILGLQLGGLLAGSIIIESVFYLPGIGRLVLLAISQRDLPVVQSIVLFIAFAVAFVNFLVDISYGYLDPRIRYE